MKHSTSVEPFNYFLLFRKPVTIEIYGELMLVQFYLSIRSFPNEIGHRNQGTGLRLRVYRTLA